MDESIPRYRLEADTFIAPQHLVKGTDILWDGPPGPHMTPLNDAAKERMAKYVEDNPTATINPVEKLPLMMVAAPAEAVVPSAVDVTKGPPPAAQYDLEQALDAAAQRARDTETLTTEPPAPVTGPTADDTKLGNPQDPGSKPEVKEAVDKANAAASAPDLKVK